MRYYAGNWAYSVWLFRSDALPQARPRLKNSAPWVDKQLTAFYDRQAIAVGCAARRMAFRLMHLHGRALPELLPARGRSTSTTTTTSTASSSRRLVLGWNFGDGHLHQEQLLAAVQAQCGFEEGELRCIFVESQPLFRGTPRLPHPRRQDGSARGG